MTILSIDTDAVGEFSRVLGREADVLRATAGELAALDRFTLWELIPRLAQLGVGGHDWRDQVGAIASALGNLAEELSGMAAGVARHVEAVRLADVLGAWSATTGSPSSRAALLTGLTRAELDRLGNDDSVPITMRIEVNRRRIADDLRTATGDRKALLDSWFKPFEDPVTGELVNPRILLYDPDLGRVAIAFGDATTAENIALSVPGTGTDINSYRLGGGEAKRAELVYSGMAKQGRGSSAVIAWFGYDAPKIISVNNPGNAGAGIEGGKSLASFTAGLVLGANQDLTLVGHSYGSLVVGEAVKAGARPKNVLVMGSPGMGVNRAGDLHLADGGHVYAMRAEMDPIGGLERFGFSPTSMAFGATRLQAFDDGELWTHSGYWSKRNVEQISKAATDNDPKGDPWPSPGEFVGEIIATPFHLDELGIDKLQEYIPDFVDGPLDWLQEQQRSIVGIATTGATELVDGAVEVGGDVVDTVVDGAGGFVEGAGNAADTALGWVGL